MKAVLFDFDGLLVDTETSIYRAWQEAYRDRGVELSLLTWAACVGTIGGFDPVADLEARTGRPFDGDEAARRLARRIEMVDGEPLRPGVAHMIAGLDARGVQRGIVSSSSRDWILGHLGRLNAGDGWATVRCADGDRSVAKPAPDLYRSALGDLGLSASEAIAVEDSPNGVAAAKAAGLFCVAVPNEVTVHLDLSAADALVPSLSDVDVGGLLRLPSE